MCDHSFREAYIVATKEIVLIFTVFTALWCFLHVLEHLHV